MEISNKNIEIKEIESLKKKYLKSEKNSAVRHALAKSPMTTTISVLEAENEIEQKFSIENKTLPITNQMASGRCWIFAGLNVLREIVAKKVNITSFELSQNYVAFYDKLEKCNYTFNTVITLIDKKPDDRELMYVLQNGIGDGGQWDMFANLVKKYGLCPKSAFKETYASSHTADIDALLNANVRRFACEAQKLHKAGKDEEIGALKDSYNAKIYDLLCSVFGVPPTTFPFEYVDKDEKYHLEEKYTPISFFEKFIGEQIDEYVSIINSPTEDKPFGKTYTIKFLGNVAEGKIITHLNLEMPRIKELIVNTLKNKELVWFGSDVSSYRNRELGAWDDNLFDYQSAFGLDIKFEKEDMLNYHQSVMSHAMVVTGVNLVKGVPTKWKIENSWGETGEKGFYVMSASWFDRYVYQAVINKKYLNEQELEALKLKAVLLPPWDPMGTLAK